MWGDRYFDLIGRQHFTDPRELISHSSHTSHFTCRTRETDTCYYADSREPAIYEVDRIDGFIPLTSLVLYIEFDWRS